MLADRLGESQNVAICTVVYGEMFIGVKADNDMHYKRNEIMTKQDNRLSLFYLRGYQHLEC